MKVLLVNPTRTGFDSYVSPPLHLLYIDQAIRKAGHDSQIIDVHYPIAKKLKTSTQKFDLEQEEINTVSNMEFDILGIGSIVSAFDFSKRLVEEVKRKKPCVPVIIGGGMSIALADLWEKRTEVDYLVESDGELVIERFLKAYPDKEKLFNIPGLYVRKNGLFIYSKPELPKNLDYIEPPDWSRLSNLEEYMEIQKRWLNATVPEEIRLKEDERVLPIVMTRGCPYQCTFCYHVNNFYRNHSIEYLVKFLSHLKNAHRLSCVVTWDDLIMTDRRWLEDLCDELIKHNLGLKIFTSGGKPNLVTRELLKKMHMAGFIRISYGIESGSQRMLDIMKKQTTVQQNFDAVKMSMEEGVFTHLNMVLGMPGETISTLRETFDFLIRLAKQGLIATRNLSFSYATGYPGTELYRFMVEHNIVKDTEDYLKEQSGVGEYKYNLCGISVGVIMFMKNIALLKIDLYSHLNKKQFGKACASTILWFSKACMELFISTKLKKFIRAGRARKRLGI